MKKYRLITKQVEAIQWKPGVFIPGVVEVKDLNYRGDEFNTAQAIFVDPTGDNILIYEGDWLVFQHGKFSKPERVNSGLFELQYESIPE